MALKKCKECGNEISTKAEVCPHCGAKNKKNIGCLGSIGIIFLFFLMVGVVADLFVEDSGSDSANKPTVSKTTKTENKPVKVKTAEEIRKEKISGCFSGWSGAHRGLERLIKSSMNDPKSYDHVETVYSDKGSYLIVKTSFRGKNAFGGTVLNSVTAKSDLDGNIIQVISQEP